MTPDLVTNAAWRAGPVPALSVVVPFYRFDVTGLAARLVGQARPLGGQVELVFLDDGSPDARDFEALAAFVRDQDVPMCAGRMPRNVGRSAIRNALLDVARAPSLVYLDADMWPDEDAFLSRYLAWAREGRVVVYGGRSARHVTRTAPEYRLHRRFTELRETLPAAERRTSPVLAFYSCNFLVRRDVLAATPLDEQFRGWGWEDCEWAARVADRHPVEHEDNPASHLGLLTVDEILAKYDESPPNFLRMRALRPALVEGTSLYRVARLLARLHLGAPLGLVARAAARARWLPDALRIRALMACKAALYARSL